MWPSLCGNVCSSSAHGARPRSKASRSRGLPPRPASVPAAMFGADAVGLVVGDPAPDLTWAGSGAAHGRSQSARPARHTTKRRPSSPVRACVRACIDRRSAIPPLPSPPLPLEPRSPRVFYGAGRAAACSTWEPTGSLPRGCPKTRQRTHGTTARPVRPRHRTRYGRVGPSPPSRCARLRQRTTLGWWRCAPLRSTAVTSPPSRGTLAQPPGALRLSTFGRCGRFSAMVAAGRLAAAVATAVVVGADGAQ